MFGVSQSETVAAPKTITLADLGVMASGIALSGAETPFIGMLSDTRLGISYANSIIYSDDGGVTWQALTAQLFAAHYGECAFCADVSTGILYAAQACGGVDNPQGTGGFQVKRFDGSMKEIPYAGLIYNQDVANYPNATVVEPIVNVLYDIPIGDRLVVCLFEPNRLVVGGGGVYYYSDNGGCYFYEASTGALVVNQTTMVDDGEYSGSDYYWQWDGTAVIDGAPVV
jgi:hypothetical protein